MSEMRNTFFDRSRNEVATSGEQAATATTTQEPQEATDTDTDTIDVEQTDAVTPADDIPSTENADAAADDAESTDDAEADDAADEDAEDTEDTESDDDNADNDDEAGDRAEVVDEDDVIAEDAAPVALVPVTVAASDAPGDAPAAAETGAVEPAVAAAEVEARPAAGVRGNTTIGDGVVSKVVNMVAGKADGVYRLDDEDSSVTVDGDIATIRIALVVEYGHAVKALAEQVRTDVIDAVEQFLGLDVAAVDVHVSDIHHPEAG